MADIYKLQYNGMTLAYPGWNGYVSWENAEVAYNLYLQQQIGGTISADKLSGMNGEIVTLGNTPDAGYQFNSYGITGAELSGNQFAFNGSDVSAQANFEEAIYTLTLQNDGHGTIAATKTTGHAGDTVTLSNTYNTYYRFNNYTVTGGTIDGSTFTFGSQDATAKANFKVNKFTLAGSIVHGSTFGNSTSACYYSDCIPHVTGYTGYDSIGNFRSQGTVYRKVQSGSNASNTGTAGSTQTAYFITIPKNTSAGYFSGCINVTATKNAYCDKQCRLQVRMYEQNNVVNSYNTFDYTFYTTSQSKYGTKSTATNTTATLNSPSANSKFYWTINMPDMPSYYYNSQYGGRATWFNNATGTWTATGYAP